MPSPVADTFKDSKYALLAIPILAGYGVMLLFFDQYLFFVPYFIFYVSYANAGNLVLDLTLTALTTLVLTVSIRQLLLRRGSPGAFKAGAAGIVAAIVAGACPCYYLIPLLAVAGAVGGTLGALGILLNAFQVPIKLAAMLLLVFALYKLNESGVCKVRAPAQIIKQS